MRDATGQQRVERKLAAIVAADIVGYSRLMGVDEVGTLQAVKGHRKALIDPTIAAHHGRIVKTTGDGILVEFASVFDAVTCSFALQRGMISRNADVPDDKRIVFRVGINVGDVIVDGDDIYGDGVNVAARLEGIAEPGGICLSDDVYRQVRGKLGVLFDCIGEQRLKNIAQPVRVYRLRMEGLATKVRPALALPDKPSIAVLPFENMGGDPEQEYFADGIVEEIITALSRFPSLFVIARNSSFTYKGKVVDIKQVGRELGVRYVLEGSVRKAGPRVRITGQLIQAETGGHVWAERYDGDFADIFELQDQIASSVAGAVVPSLEKAEIERAQRNQPENLDAYDLYLQALPHWRAMTRDGNDRAIELLKRAIDIDCRFVSALKIYALCLRERVVLGDPLTEVRTEPIRYARMAVAQDKDDPQALVVLAFLLSTLAGQHAEAISLSEQAVQLNPNSGDSLRLSGWVNVFAGRSETAFRYFEQAQRLSPRDPMDFAIRSGQAVALIQLGRYEQAVAAARKAVQLKPTYVQAWRHLAAAQALQGNIDEARAAVARQHELEPTGSMAHIRQLRQYAEHSMTHYFEGLRKAGMSE